MQNATLPALTTVEGPDGRLRVRLSGEWTVRAIGRGGLARLRRRLASDRGSAWDLRDVALLDHAGALLLWRAWGRRWAPQVELRPEHRRLFEHLEDAPRPVDGPHARRPAVSLERLGHRTFDVLAHLRDLLALLGETVLAASRLPRNVRRMPWREISANVYRTGAQALAITALVGFLVGVVLSYLSAQQLRAFGADIFIVNLLGVSIVRELGPVLAAILIAGRSGSAMTAQLGVIRVTQELDAMSVMGIPHTLRLVLPRMLALAVAMPLLILWTNAVALVGGMVTARLRLGLGIGYFVSALPEAVPIANLWLGLGKGVVFGLFIALIACHFGLRVQPNTVSLGAGTTASIVTAITAVILIDALFAILFSDVGIFQ